MSYGQMASRCNILYIKIERRGTRDLHTVCPTKLRSFHYIYIEKRIILLKYISLNKIK